MMQDSTARLLGAHEAAKRLLYNESGIPRSWPDKATPYRRALEEIFAAVGEILGNRTLGNRT